MYYHVPLKCWSECFTTEKKNNESCPMCQPIAQFLVKKSGCGAKGETGTREKIRSHLGVILWGKKSSSIHKIWCRPCRAPCRWCYGAFHLAQQSEFRAGNDAAFKLTTSQLHTEKARWCLHCCCKHCWPIPAGNNPLQNSLVCESNTSTLQHTVRTN